MVTRARGSFRNNGLVRLVDRLRSTRVRLTTWIAIWVRSKLVQVVYVRFPLMGTVPGLRGWVPYELPAAWTTLFSPGFCEPDFLVFFIIFLDLFLILYRCVFFEFILIS
jgi:hypothetical protein